MTVIFHAIHSLNLSATIPKASMIPSAISNFLYEKDSPSYFLHANLRSRNHPSWLLLWHHKLNFYKLNLSLSPTNLFFLLYSLTQVLTELIMTYFPHCPKKKYARHLRFFSRITHCHSPSLIISTFLLSLKFNSPFHLLLNEIP